MSYGALWINTILSQCWQTGLSSFSSALEVKVREHVTIAEWLFEQTLPCARDITEEGEHEGCCFYCLLAGLLILLKLQRRAWEAHNNTKAIGSESISHLSTKWKCTHLVIRQMFMSISHLLEATQSPHILNSLVQLTPDNHYLISLWQGLSQQNINSKLGQKDYYF